MRKEEGKDKKKNETYRKKESKQERKKERKKERTEGRKEKLERSCRGARYVRRRRHNEDKRCALTIIGFVSDTAVTDRSIAELRTNYNNILVLFIDDCN